jgi:GT2 family glycosyltransferase
MYIKENYPWVKIIAFTKNLGFAKAYNEAVKKLTDTNFVVFLNNDTKVDNTWLSALAEEIFQDDCVVAVGSKLRLYYSPTLLHNAGTKISPVNGGFDIGLFEKDGEQFSIRTYVGATCGASMLVRRDVFLKIGGFDETYFAFFEDVDFCWRAWLYGYKVVYAPASVVYHERGGSFGQKSELGIFLGGRNQLITIIKNCQSLTLLAGIYFITPILMARVVLSLKEKRLGDVFATFNSVLYILKNLREIFYKRQIIQRNRVISDRKLLSMGVMATISETIRAELRLLPSKAVET